MGLRDLSLATMYRSGRDSLLDDFYIPCLQESILYDRAVGYFSSTLYHVAAVAFSDFASRGGKMRLICSPSLTPEDFKAMKDGDELAAQAQESVRTDLKRLLSDAESLPATRLLATLIAFRIVEVRIAFPTNPAGLFHDKLGIFEDADGRRVSFVGSANETWRAWGLNHESFEVYGSWRNEPELLRIRDHVDAFRSLWRGIEPGVRVETLDQVTQEQLKEVADDDLEHAIQAARSTSRPPEPVGLQLLEHQRLVLEDWEANSHRGIVNFATGAGKTITAIDGVRRWTSSGGVAIVLVPGRDLHEQWMREISTRLPKAEILPAGAGHGRETWESLLAAFSSPPPSGATRIVLATNLTFASDSFQRRLRSGEHLLLVADEMHRAGSRKVIDALEATAVGATLGLSATYRRQFDDAGTDRLLQYFGRVLEPVVGLAEAMIIGLLVPYDYRLHELQLDDDEAAAYLDLSKRVGHLIAQGRTVSEDSLLQMLLIKRARILKQARRKVPTAVAILSQEYTPGDRWLVYCDSLTQVHALVEALIDLSLPALEFYSDMPGDREAVLRSLRAHGGIVVAIRCLDEGIDIPVTDHALILASSTAEREYIQRRGRVLRTAPDKVTAEIHDLILVDQHGGALTRTEALRALEFVRLARNPAARERLKSIVALSDDPIDIENAWPEEEDAET